METSDRFQHPELKREENCEEVVALGEAMGKEKQQVSPRATHWGLSSRELRLQIGIPFSRTSRASENETQELKSKYGESLRAPNYWKALFRFWLPATLYTGSPKAFENNLFKIGQEEKGSKNTWFPTTYPWDVAIDY